MVTRVNDWVADALDRLTSNMWAFWALLAFIIVVIKLNPPDNLQTAALDALSIAFQTLMLIVLQSKGTKVQQTAEAEGAKSRALLQETHDTVMAEHAETQEILDDVRQMVVRLSGGDA